MKPRKLRKEALVAVVQWISRVWLFVTPWTAASQASLSFTISLSLLKHMSIELVMPSNHLVLCHSLLLLPSIFPSIRGFSNESAVCIRWPKYWNFCYSISPSNEYSGLISLERGAMDSSGPESRFCPLCELPLEGWEESQSSLAQKMQHRAGPSLDTQFQLLIPLANWITSLLIVSEPLTMAKFCHLLALWIWAGNSLVFWTLLILSFLILYKKIINL